MARLQMPFVSGVREDIDTSVLPNPMLAKAENVRMTLSGQIEKRPGMTAAGGAISGGGTLAAIESIDSLGDAQLLRDDTGLYTRLDDEDSWTLLGETPKQAIASVLAVNRSDTEDVQTVGCAVNQGVLMSVVQDGTRQVVSAYDIDRAATVTRDVFLSTTGAGLGNAAAVVAVGDYLIASQARLDVTDLASGIDTTKIVGATVAVMAEANGDLFTIDNGGTGTHYVVDGSGYTSQGNFGTGAMNAADHHAILGDTANNRIWVLHYNISTRVLAYETYNATTRANVLAAVTVITETAGTSDMTRLGIGETDTSTTKVFVWESENFGTGKPEFNYQAWDDAGVKVQSSSEAFTDVIVQTKPWRQNGRTYVMAHTQYGVANVPNRRAVVLELDANNATPINLTAEMQMYSGRAAQEDTATTYTTIAADVGIDSTTGDAFVPMRHWTRSAGGGVGTTFRIGGDVVRMSVNRKHRSTTAVLAGTLYLGGGSVDFFDGEQTAEVGFYGFPFIDSVADGAAGSIPAGTYQYVAVWEWTDRLGNRHQSAPSVPVSHTAAGSKETDIVIRPLHLSRKTRLSGTGVVQKFINCAIYRTTVGGTIFYRLDEQTTAFPVVDPNTTADLTFTDPETDATLTNNEILYTEGGVLDNVAPPPSKFIVAHGDQLVGINDEDPRVVWYSKPFNPGRGIAWNETLIERLDDGAECTALASQDGRLIVFKSDRVFLINGRGPNALGVSNQAVQKLSVEIGCTEPRSVVVAPPGIFFRSARGIELLPRGGIAVQYIGNPVRATLEALPEVLDTLHLPDKSQVLFSVANAAETVGAVLVYDYRVGQWFIDSYNSVMGNGVAHRSLANWQDKLAITRATAPQIEDATTFDDSGSTVQWLIQTGDIRPGGLQGYQRFRGIAILGESRGARTFQVQVQYNGDYNAIGDTASFTVTEVSGNSWRRFSAPPRGRLETFRVTIFDAAGSDTDLVMNGLEFEYRDSKRQAPHAAAQRG